MVLIEIEPCQAETMRVIGMAERYVKKNRIQKGQIWCVYDEYSFPADDFNGVVNRAENLNKENSQLQYHTAWSNNSLENVEEEYLSVSRYRKLKILSAKEYENRTEVLYVHSKEYAYINEDGQNAGVWEKEYR